MLPGKRSLAQGRSRLPEEPQEGGASFFLPEVWAGWDSKAAVCASGYRVEGGPPRAWVPRPSPVLSAPDQTVGGVPSWTQQGEGEHLPLRALEPWAWTQSPLPNISFLSAAATNEHELGPRTSSPSHTRGVRGRLCSQAPGPASISTASNTASLGPHAHTLCLSSESRDYTEPTQTRQGPLLLKPLGHPPRCPCHAI